MRLRTHKKKRGKKAKQREQREKNREGRLGFGHESFGELGKKEKRRRARGIKRKSRGKRGTRRRAEQKMEETSNEKNTQKGNGGFSFNHPIKIFPITTAKFPTTSTGCRLPPLSFHHPSSNSPQFPQTNPPQKPLISHSAPPHF